MNSPPDGPQESPVPVAPHTPEAPDPAPPPAPPDRPGWPAAAAFVLVGLFGFLLASFPARNADLWAHLAAGRAFFGGPALAADGVGADVAARGPGSWLWDVGAFALFAAAGGPGLVAAKALLVAALALALLRLCRPGRGGWVAPFCAALAL